MKQAQRNLVLTVAAAAAVWLAPTSAHSGNLKFGLGTFDETSGGEDPTTLPLVGGGLGEGGWWVDDPSALGGGLPIGSQSQPTLAIVGYAYQLDLAVLASHGTGFGIVESLPGGLERLSFHGAVELTLDPSLFESGLVQMELHVPNSFHAASAAVQWQGVWGDTFGLEGSQVISVPSAALTIPAHGGGAHFAAINPVGDQYVAGFSKVTGLPGLIRLSQDLSQ